MSDRERAQWARALTTAGWLVLTGYLLLVVAQLRRALSIRSSPFEDGVWGQRAEVVSLVAQPQNLVILAIASVAAVVANVLTRHGDLVPVAWAPQLVRVVAGTSYLAVALGAVGIIDHFVQTPDSVGGTFPLLNRVAGILMAVAMIRVCLESERASAG
ncbi:MAG: hypothetical protein AB7K08_15210 [Microbacteriaceae bacterium]